MPRRRKPDFTLEEVARMVIHRRAPPISEGEKNGENSRNRPKVTLPQVAILGDWPAWWDEDFERRPIMHSN